MPTPEEWIVELVEKMKACGYAPPYELRAQPATLRAINALELAALGFTIEPDHEAQPGVLYLVPVDRSW